MVFGWVTFVLCHTGFIATVRRRPTGFMDRQNYLNETMVKTSQQNVITADQFAQCMAL